MTTSVNNDAADSQGLVKLLSAVGGILALAGVMAWVGSSHEQAQQQNALQIEVLTNSIGMSLVKIPAGEFTMGDDEAGIGPERRVRVAPFYMASHEVTLAQWMAVMGYVPGNDQGASREDPRRPVVNLTWLEVQSFLEELNRLEGTNKYRLPSEAEWEYAARAGSETRYFYGDDQTQLRRFAVVGEHNGARPVGGKQANPWGLHDIYGNVWEWVQDCWHDDYQRAPGRGIVWGGGDCVYRVVRGGGWSSRAQDVGSAVRGSYPASDSDLNTGFRVVMLP